MSIHTTTPSTAEETGPEADEPVLRRSRFDERGIALQTIIIMVVLLAIAATVAGVLLQRAGQETARLETQDTAEVTDYNVFKSETACRLAANGQGLMFAKGTAAINTVSTGTVYWNTTAKTCARGTMA